MRHIRQFLFKVLGLDNYLKVIRKSFFVLFRSGLLRRDPVYDWHYFVKNLIRKKDVIIDIGANMGYYSSIFSNLVGSDGRVYCVEPVAPLIKQLKRQVKNKKHVVILPFALGDENKNRVFLSVGENIPKAGYLQHGLFSVQDEGYPGDDKFTFSAVQCKGSEVFAGLSRLDYIKCDVEGYEKIILTDLEDLLNEYQPMVQVEIRQTHFGTLIKSFEERGYRAFKLLGPNLVAVESLPLRQQFRFDTLLVPPRHFNRIRPFIISVHSGKPLPQPVRQADLQTDP